MDMNWSSSYPILFAHDNFKFCRIWRSQKESVSLGFLIKKTLQFPKSSMYKEALELEEPPEEFLKP